MADFVFNIAKGKVAEKAADGATLRILVLKTANTDAINKDYDNLNTLLTDGTNAEADFTNYPATRKALANITPSVDDTNDKFTVDADDVTYTSAGGASNNTTEAAIIYEDVAGDDSSDATAIPLAQFDAVFTTDGNDVTLQFHADGFFEAS